MGDGAPNGEQSVPIEELRDHVLLEYSTAKESLRRRRHRKILNSLAKISPLASTSSAPPPSAQSQPLNGLKQVTPLEIPAAVLPPVEKLPDGIAWVRASTNVRLPECFSDNYYVPYLGESDEHQASSSKLAKILCDDDSEKEDNSDVEGLDADAGTSSSSDDDDDDDDDAEGVVIVGADFNRTSRESKESRRLRRLATKRAKKERQLPPSSKVGELKWDRTAKLIALQRFSAIFLPPNCDELTPDCAMAVKDAFRLADESVAHAYMAVVTKRVQMWEIKKKGEEQLETVRAEVINHIQGNGSSSAATVLNGDSIPFFFCRQCYVYDCPLHENCDSGPTVPIPDRTRKDSATKQVIDDIEKACRDHSAGDCWSLGSKDDDCAKWWADSYDTSVNLVDDLKALLKALLPSFGKDFCRVSETVRTLLRDSHDTTSLTCCRIGYVSNTLFNSLLVTPLPPRLKKNQKMRTCKPAAEMEFMNGGIRPDYKPCRHDGPCTAENCTCVVNGVFCEKYCGCNHTRPKQMKYARRCNNAFPGCSCKSACSSNLCPCYSWKRECDPDLCRYCHECKPSSDGKFNFACRNVSLRLKRNCRVLAGRSRVHGWGVFAAHDIPQNEMVGEYVGEVLGDQVAERRGRLYDEVQSTFLFEITKGLSLDSTRIGNKLRYCNHSSDANLEPRLMRVGGDVRIGIFARKGIKKFEEMFFNYGSKFKNRWEMKDSKDGKAELRSTTQVKSIAIAWESGDENGDFSGFGERSAGGKGQGKRTRRVDRGRSVGQNLDRRNRKTPTRDRRRNSLQGPALISNDLSPEFRDKSTSAENGVQSRRHSSRLIRGSHFTPLLAAAADNEENHSEDDDDDNGSCPYGNPLFRSASSKSKIMSSPRASVQAKRDLLNHEQSENRVAPKSHEKRVFGRRRSNASTGARGQIKLVSSSPDESSAVKKKNQEIEGPVSKQRAKSTADGPPSGMGSGGLQRANNNNNSNNIDFIRTRTPELGSRGLERYENPHNPHATNSQINGLGPNEVTPVKNDSSSDVDDPKIETGVAREDTTAPELTGKHAMSSISDADADKVEGENVGVNNDNAQASVSNEEGVRSSKRRLSNQAKARLPLGTARNSAKRHKFERGVGSPARGKRVTKSWTAPLRNNQENFREDTTTPEETVMPTSRQKTPGGFRWDRWRDHGTTRATQSFKSKRGSRGISVPPSKSPRKPSHQPHFGLSPLRAGKKGSINPGNPTKRPDVNNNPATGLAAEIINLVTDDEDEQGGAASGLNRGNDSDTSFDPNFGKYTLT